MVRSSENAGLASLEGKLVFQIRQIHQACIVPEVLGEWGPGGGLSPAPVVLLE